MPQKIWNEFLKFLESLDYVQIGIFAVILIIGMILRKIAIKAATAFFRVIDKKTKTHLFENYLKPILKPLGNFVILLAIYIGLHVTKIPNTPYPFKKYLTQLNSILLILNLAWFFLSTVNIFMMYLENKAAKTESKLDDQLVPILKKFLKGIVFVLSAIVILQNLGYSVSGLVAGIGLGGFALAFAAKDTLANIFGSVMIFLDRPFQIGDWVKTPNFEGTVEEVGLRSTRIRTFAKTKVSAPNNIIANAVIENLSEMPKRRVKFILGVTYSTKVAQMKQLIAEIKDILRAHQGVDQEFFLVRFSDFGASSLDILIYYFTKTTDWQEHSQIKEDINLLIMEKTEELNISIAFPSQSLYIEQMPFELKEK